MSIRLTCSKCSVAAWSSVFHRDAPHACEHCGAPMQEPARPSPARPSARDVQRSAWPPPARPASAAGGPDARAPGLLSAADETDR